MLMPRYLYLLHPYRHDCFAHPKPHEQEVLKKHRDYLQQAQQAGQVILSGLCLDETFALVLLQAADEQAAEEFMFRDPAVAENLMAAELHPFCLDLSGGGVWERDDGGSVL